MLTILKVFLFGIAGLAILFALFLALGAISAVVLSGRISRQEEQFEQEQGWE